MSGAAGWAVLGAGGAGLLTMLAVLTRWLGHDEHDGARGKVGVHVHADNNGAWGGGLDGGGD